MSQANVEIVRSALAAYNRGDLDAAFRDAIPDAEVDMSGAVGTVEQESIAAFSGPIRVVG